jgi:hypothetical protein
MASDDNPDDLFDVAMLIDELKVRRRRPRVVCTAETALIDRCFFFRWGWFAGH